jgi:hypothetical protein
MSNLLEPLETINKRLKDQFGRFHTTDMAMWRVVWSEDQTEKRWTDHTDEGFPLIRPEVRELPKYRQWIKDKYVLERLIAVPEYVQTDLIEKLTYEPVWVFEDKQGNPLPPKWEAIFLIINQVYKTAANYTGAKYKDPDVLDPKLAKEQKQAKIDALVEELFGNETSTGDSLAYKEGVSVPHNYGDNNGQ